MSAEDLPVNLFHFFGDTGIELIIDSVMESLEEGFNGELEYENIFLALIVVNNLVSPPGTHDENLDVRHPLFVFTSTPS